MINKKILVIDNDDQSDVLNELQKDAKKQNVILDYYQFNIGGALEQSVLDDDGNLDIEAAKSLFMERFAELHFDIIACDYDLDVENITGIELVRQMKGTCFAQSQRILMYSGLLNEIVKEHIQKYCSITTNDKGDQSITIDDFLLKTFKHLINSSYLGFKDRGDYCSAILQHLKDDVGLADIFDEVVTQYPDLELAYNLGHKYNGYKLSECKDEILQNDELRNEVMQDLVQQTMLYLTKYMAHQK